MKNVEINIVKGLLVYSRCAIKGNDSWQYVDDLTLLSKCISMSLVDGMKSFGQQEIYDALTEGYVEPHDDIIRGMKYKLTNVLRYKDKDKNNDKDKDNGYSFFIESGYFALNESKNLIDKIRQFIELNYDRTREIRGGIAMDCQVFIELPENWKDMLEKQYECCWEKYGKKELNRMEILQIYYRNLKNFCSQKQGNFRK